MRVCAGHTLYKGKNGSLSAFRPSGEENASAPAGVFVRIRRCFRSKPFLRPPRRDGVLHPVLDVGRVDVVHRIHLPALIVCVKGGEYALLESEYRLCRDFQRGKQLSAEQLARLRSSGFLEQPLFPADIEARPPDYVPQLNRHALEEMEQYRSGRFRLLLETFDSLLHFFDSRF